MLFSPLLIVYEEKGSILHRTCFNGSKSAGDSGGLSPSTRIHKRMGTHARKHGDLLSAGESGVQCPHWQVLTEEKDEEWMGLRGRVEGTRGG